MATATLRPTQAAARTAILASADWSFRQRVREALTGLRWQVREASGGAEALAHLDQAPAETLILDSWLPDLEIQEFISEFEKLHPSVDLVTVDDTPARRNVIRSPRRNEVLFALRRGQDSGAAADNCQSGIERPAVEEPSNPIALKVEEKTSGEAIRQMATSRGNSAACRLPEFIGDHPLMLKVSHRIRLVAPHRTPVLVEGPTGTGKELVARALHRLSTRSSRPTAIYKGDSNVNYVQTPSGQQIQTNLPGNQIFTAAGANVLGTLNSLIADFSSGAPTAASSADLTSLNDALNYVSQQRVVLDDSITRLTAAGNYSASESTQLQSAQDSLIQTNTAQVASQLSSAETQQAALTQVIAAIDKQGTLFNELQ